MVQWVKKFPQWECEIENSKGTILKAFHKRPVHLHPDI